MAIAFFDSGIGGLTVLSDAMELMPHTSFIYFADTEHVPYGTKNHDEIVALVKDAIEFLMQFKPDGIVLACNTATSVVANELREMYDIPIIGMEPAIKPASEHTQHNILVTATKRTLAEEKLERLITKLDIHDRVEMCDLQELVKYAENYDFHSPKLFKYLACKFSKYDWSKFEAIVLGCTHFLYFKKLIRRLVPPHVQILDGNWGTVKHLQNQIAVLPQQTCQHKFFSSKKEVPAHFWDHFIRKYREEK